MKTDVERAMEVKKKRRSPCVPPVTKHTLRAGGTTYRVMAAVKEAGRVTRKDLEYVLPDVPAMSLRHALDALRKRGNIHVIGWERGSGTRCLTVYSADRNGYGNPTPLQPLPQSERQARYLAAKRLRAVSVFDWRGQVSL
jgi:hypothetical protein